MILDAKAKAALAYALGLVSGIIALVLEKKDPYVRFHALQSVLAFTAVALVSLLLPTIPILGSWPIVRFVFVIAVAGLWITLIIKAVQGEAYRLPYVGDIAANYSMPSGKT